MYVSPNLQNFYRTKQASLMDYLKAMGIGAGIGGGAGAGLGAWGGSKWDDEFSPEVRAVIEGRMADSEISGDADTVAVLQNLLDAGSPQESMKRHITHLEENEMSDVPIEQVMQQALAGSMRGMNQNPKTIGGVIGGLGGAALGAGGGLGYQALKDLLFSGGKEARVKRAALSEEDLVALKALIEEVEQEKRVKRKSGPKYGQRFLSGALSGGLVGAPYGALMGGIVGDQTNELPEGIALGGLGGLVGGAGLGGLSNMLNAYMQGDLYDRVAEV